MPDLAAATLELVGALEAVLVVAIYSEPGR